MAESPLTGAHRLLEKAMSAWGACAGPGASDDELLSVLTMCAGVARCTDRLAVTTVATLSRRGVFTERGYQSPAAALADLLGWERCAARRRVVAAEWVCPRIGLDGTVAPARLAATAQVFAAGGIGLRHIEIIARVLDTPAAARLSPEVWAGAEDDLAGKATLYTPTELLAYGTALVDTLDDDGPVPDDTPPPQVNELNLTRHRGRPGGSIKGRFDDAAMFDAIATVLDATSTPLTAEDDRSTATRQGAALAEVCGYVLDHADCVPECGGHRPHLNIVISLADLEARARAAMLDFGGTLTPEALRMLACNAAVIPVVMNGEGQPLDVGRSTRVIPDGLRRAVAVRDRGCAFPGCGRTPSWCEVHHIRQWQEGGETKLGNCVMLCRTHHRLLHHPGWVVQIRDGLPEFIPPQWVDPKQVSRRRPLPHLILRI